VVRAECLQHDWNCKDRYRWALEIYINNNSYSSLGGHTKSLTECTRDHRGADLVRRGKLSSCKASAAAVAAVAEPHVEVWEIDGRQTADGMRHTVSATNSPLSWEKLQSLAQ